MAAPLALPLGGLGGAIGKAIAEATARPTQGTAAAVLFLPIWSGVESNWVTHRELVVVSKVEIDAPVHEVWEHVIDFPELPEPVELTPYRHVHPPHLDGALRSNRGEFRLVELPNGGTLLEGRTWYEFDMFPQAYWTLWSDLMIHRIHERVLLHVKRLAESEMTTP